MLSETLRRNCYLGCQDLRGMLGTDQLAFWHELRNGPRTVYDHPVHSTTGADTKAGR
jgi:hypothetical protein